MTRFPHRSLAAGARAVLLGSCLLAPVVWAPDCRAGNAEAIKRYDEAKAEFERGRFADARRKVNEALRELARPGASVRVYGVVLKSYFPYFLLGRIALEEGNPEQALQEFSKEEEFGEIRKNTREYTSFQRAVERARREAGRSRETAPAPIAKAAPPEPVAPVPAAPPPTAGPPSSPAGPSGANAGPAKHPGETAGAGGPSVRAPTPAVQAPPPAGTKTAPAEGVDPALRKAQDEADHLLRSRRAILGTGDERSLRDLRKKLDDAREGRDGARVKTLTSRFQSQTREASNRANAATRAVRSAFDEAAQGRYPAAIERLENLLRAQKDNAGVQVVLASLYFAAAQQSRPSDARKVSRARELLSEAFHLRKDLKLPETWFSPRFLAIVREARS